MSTLSKKLMNGDTHSTSSESMRIRDARKLFSAVNALSDLIEDILEKNSMYDKEFLHGLSQSLSDTHNGKVTRIESVKELGGR